MPEDPFEILDLLPEAIIIASDRGNLTHSNAAARELFQIDGGKATSFKHLVVDPPDKIDHALQLWSSSRQFLPMAFRLQASQDRPVIRCDGALIRPAAEGRPASLLIRCIPRAEASATNLFVKLNTEIEAMIKHLAQQRITEAERVNNLATAAAVFVHEVANPLNAISTSLQCLQLDLRGRQDIDPDILNSVNEATAEIGRLSFLLRHFRNFARPQFISLEPTDLKTIINEIVSLELLAFHNAGGAVRLDVEAMPLVMADRVKIKQAILNVCKNAVEAMPGGGELSIRGYHIDSSDTVALEIRDTGVGIPEGLDVFGLFKTTKANASGLGLPIVEQILSAHRGAVSYVSQQGEGTVFKIVLPCLGQ